MLHFSYFGYYLYIIFFPYSSLRQMLSCTSIFFVILFLRPSLMNPIVGLKICCQNYFILLFLPFLLSFHFKNFIFTPHVFRWHSHCFLPKPWQAIFFLSPGWGGLKCKIQTPGKKCDWSLKSNLPPFFVFFRQSDTIRKILSAVLFRLRQSSSRQEVHFIKVVGQGRTAPVRLFGQPVRTAVPGAI